MDQKAFLMGGGFLAVLTVGTLAVMFHVTSPDGDPVRREPMAIPNRSGGTSIPAQAAQPPRASRTRADAVPASSLDSMPTPEDWKAGGASGSHGPRSSLGFIQKEEGFSGGTGGGSSRETSAEAQAAAAAGDVKGMVASLQAEAREAAPEPGQMSKAAIRRLMQTVVDAVHENQPSWYSQFLADPDLKAIADRYDRDQDFATFLRLLYKSRSFHGMLKKTARTSSFRSLVGTLMRGETGAGLERLFFQHGKDPNLLNLVKFYGSGSGLPRNVLAHAGVEEKPSRAARKPASRAYQKPKLEKRSLSGGFGANKFAGGTASSGGQDQQQQQQGGQQMPAGVTPEMLQQYQKYMKK